MKRIITLLLTLTVFLALAVPGSANGWFPEESAVREDLMYYQNIYPEGTPWSDANTYNWSGGIYSGGSGCVAFAFELSDYAFGDHPARQIDDVVFEQVRIGDILRISGKSVIVIDTYTDYLVLAEGNYNNSVHWGRTLVPAEVEAAEYLLTRYPEIPTEEEVYAAMMALKPQYPEGMPWTNDNYYAWNGGIFSGGYGCAGFAFILSDAAFGQLPARRIDQVKFEDVRVGDILRVLWDTHSVIVTEVHEDYVVLAEGNYNSSIHWGRTMTREEVEASDYLMTRYPLEADDSDDEAADSIIPDDAVILDRGYCGDNNGPNVQWAFCNNGTLYLTGIGTTGDYSMSAPGWVDYVDSITKVVVDQGITRLGHSIFFYHTALKEAVLPDSLQEIAYGAFRYCTALANVEGGRSVKDIGAYAFCSCTALTEFDFPETLESINIDAFEASGITKAILPEGLRSLGHFAFANCDSLTEIYIPSTVTNNLQYLCDRDGALVTVTLGEGLEGLGRYCFQDCGSLKEVYLPESITYIGEHCFTNSGLTAVSLPESALELGDYAFSGCPDLQSLYIPGTVASFGKDVFAHCDSLAYVTLEEGLTEMGFGMFWGCDSLRRIELPTTMTKIGGYAMYETGLVYFQVPDTITEIGMWAFGYCEDLQLLTIPTSVTTMGQDPVEHCDNLWQVHYLGTQEQYDAIEHTSSNLLHDYHNILFVDQTSCGHEYTAELNAISSSSCTGSDLSDGEYCVSCGFVTKDGLISQGSHDWTEWEPLDQYSEGHRCSKCGKFEYRPLTTHPEHPDQPDEPNEPDQPQPSVKFTDVAEGSWYADAVSWAVNLGVTNGIGDGLFGPDQNCTRAQVVTFLWRAAGSPEPQSSSNPFKDVDVSAWYGKAVLWAVEKGITNGMTATTFGTDQTCTRAQVATFLWRAQGQPDPGYSGNPFRDVDPASWYGEAVLWAVVNGITNGMGQGTFAPDGTCTRGQIVTFLYRALV